MAGVVVLLFDPAAIKNGQNVNIWADLACLLINFPYAIYYVGQDYLKDHFSLFFLITQGVVFNYTFAVVLAVLVEGRTLDMTDHGVFGFMRPDTAFISFVVNGLGTTILGTYASVWALRYFSPVTVMNTALLMPVKSQIIGVMFGTDTWPGWMTWLGILIIFIAINLMYQGEQLRPLMATQDVDEAEQKAKDADAEFEGYSDKNKVVEI